MWERFFAADLAPEELPAMEAQLEQLGELLRASGLRYRGGRFTAHAGGLHCERLFGPMRTDRCACGKWEGAQHRGRCCDRCGVVLGDPAERERRWARLSCPTGLVHPALLACACQDLGLSGDPLAWDPEDETLPVERLERRWGRSLRVRQIPVSPPGGRLRGPLPRGHLPTPGPEELALISLVGRTRRLSWLVELCAPTVIIAGEMAAASAALARYLGSRGADGAPRRFPDLSSCSPTLPARCPPARRRQSWEGRRPWIDGLAFWGERLLLCGARGLMWMDLHTGRGRRIPCGEARLVGVSDGCAVFNEVSWRPEGRVRGPGREQEQELSRGYAALDLSSGRWLDRLPPALTLAFGRDQPEDGWVEELATGQIDDLGLSSDRPAFGAYTPDLRDMMAMDDEDGLVLDGQTGHALLWVEEPDGGRIRLAGRRREVESGAAHDRGGPPAVVHLGDRRWRALMPSGVLVDVDGHGRSQGRWLLPRPHSAAAFDPTGERLAVAWGGTVQVLDTEGRLLRCLRLPQGPTRKKG